MRSLKALKTKKQTAPVEKLSASALEQGLVVAIDDHLFKRNASSFKKVNGFHPSYINQCARYWYYLFNGVNIETNFSAQTHRIFDNGNSVHGRLYSYFRDMGILLQEEIAVHYDNPPIEGTADGIINWYGEKLIELKSISSEGFHYRQIYKKPKDEHYRQAQIYMECLNLDSGFVIYENKNNQEILPIYVDKDQEFISKLFTKYKNIYGNYINQSIPEQPYKITSKNCQSCDLRSLCWSGVDEKGKEDLQES
jgi:CRISPR/Cas system-associated exonuclease Cas4 (RecB family)